MNELNDIETIVVKSLDQTASEQELKQLHAWLKESKDNQTSYYQLKDVFDATSDYQIPQTAKAWRQLEQKTKIAAKAPYWLKETLKVAAVAALVFVASYLAFMLPKHDGSDVATAKVIVPNGSQSTVILADGTSVQLNAGSELIYPSHFGGDARKVQLKGEAYFKVQHNANHPFIVSAGELDVKVLGTEFNVMAYSEARRIETTLVDGSVELTVRGAEVAKSLILKPGQKAVLKNGQLDVSPANLELETTWTNHGFYFQSTGFEELIMKLERWYDVDIVFDTNDFKDITFTGKFKNKETIWQVLDVIQMTTPVKYHSKDGKIYVTLIKP
ncbi:FecR family protein [Carboxylicivirga taeanensis]|uniref:FecR family protein n=1 Tax=Carboxylicivirga taeanensis TaxID=1416875 RepID=UPI003F6E2896